MSLIQQNIPSACSHYLVELEKTATKGRYKAIMGQGTAPPNTTVIDNVVPIRKLSGSMIMVGKIIGIVFMGCCLVNPEMIVAFLSAFFGDRKEPKSRR